MLEFQAESKYYHATLLISVLFRAVGASGAVSIESLLQPCREKHFLRKKSLLAVMKGAHRVGTFNSCKNLVSRARNELCNSPGCFAGPGSSKYKCQCSRHAAGPLEQDLVSSDDVSSGEAVLNDMA